MAGDIPNPDISSAFNMEQAFIMPSKGMFTEKRKKKGSSWYAD